MIQGRICNNFMVSLQKWIEFPISCLLETNEKLSNFNTESEKKNIFHIIDQIKVSGIAIFAWKAPCNYAYSPLITYVRIYFEMVQKSNIVLDTNIFYLSFRGLLEARIIFDLFK